MLLHYIRASFKYVYESNRTYTLYIYIAQSILKYVNDILLSENYYERIFTKELIAILNINII